MMRSQRARVRRLSLGAVVVVLSAWVVSLSGPSVADVTAVKGSAYGFSASNITLFTSPQPAVPPTPSVTLAPDAGNSPQSSSTTTGLIKYGPATLFSSDAVMVSSQGTTGPNGSVTSASNIQNINKSALQPAVTGGEAFTATALLSTCTANETDPATGAKSVSGSTTVTAGTLLIDTGEDLNNDGDFTDPGEHPPVEITVPTNPAVGESFAGHIHVNGARDDFEYIFNEQITASDGSLIVNAVHQRLLGPTATGDVILGQVVCGVTAVGTGTTSTTVPASTTSTTLPSSTTSTTVPSSTTSTTLPSSTTSTTLPSSTTSTTLPSSTTSTTLPSSTTSTTVPPSTTSTTVPPSTTSTTVPPTTSTTVAPTTTSTTVPPSTTSTTVPPTTSTTVAPTTTTTITGDVTTGLLSFVMQIICDVLRSLVNLPFVGPIIRALLTAFDC